MTDYYVDDPAPRARPEAWQHAPPVRRRSARTRRYAMTPPTYYAVEYAINPWMDVSARVEVEVAFAQWEALRQTYLRLGHRVDIVEPVPGLPDMVYAANGGFVAGDIAIVARFRYEQRAGEAGPTPIGCRRWAIRRWSPDMSMRARATC